MYDRSLSIIHTLEGMSIGMARNYVNNRDFYEAIKTYQTKLLENPNAKVPDYIGICIQQIATKFSTKPNFVGYSYRDEMIADAIENCMYALPKFNPERTINPFAYFTQVVKNAFIRRILLEKKEQYIKYKNLQNAQFAGTMDYMEYGDSGSLIYSKTNEIADTIIGDFEKKLTKPKKRVSIGIEQFFESTHETK